MKEELERRLTNRQFLTDTKTIVGQGIIVKIVDIITMAMSSKDAQVAQLVHEMLDEIIAGSNETKENEEKGKLTLH